MDPPNRYLFFSISPQHMSLLFSSLLRVMKRKEHDGRMRDLSSCRVTCLLFLAAGKKRTRPRPHLPSHPLFHRPTLGSFSFFYWSVDGEDGREVCDVWASLSFSLFFPSGPEKENGGKKSADRWKGKGEKKEMGASKRRRKSPREPKICESKEN